MAAKIIGEDCDVLVTFKGTQDGTPDTPGVIFGSVKMFLRSAKLNVSWATADVAAIGDATQKMQKVKASGTLEIEVVTNGTNGTAPTTMPIFQGKDGFYCDITIAPGTLTSRVYSGVIYTYSFSVSSGEAVTENVTITLGTNGIDGFVV